MHAVGWGSEPSDGSHGGVQRRGVCLLLAVVSFLPFPTRLLAEYTREREAERVAAAVYGINLLLTLVLMSVRGATPSVSSWYGPTWPTRM